MHGMAPGGAFRPELRMAVLGLAWRREPIVEELLLLLVPSPLQVSCRVESCPGMVMDLAVEGGLQSEGKEVTDCHAGSSHHSVHPNLLSRRKLAALRPAAQMGCWVLFAHMQDWCLPYPGLHYKKKQVFEIN